MSSKSIQLTTAASFGPQMTALTLLKEEDFPSLGCLLDREFRPLSRLLVLLGWTHCQSLASAKRLLETLHRTQVTHCSTGCSRSQCSGTLGWGRMLGPGVGHSLWPQVPESVSLLLHQHRTKAVTSSWGMPVMGCGPTWRSWSGAYSTAGRHFAAGPHLTAGHTCSMLCTCGHFRASST